MRNWSAYVHAVVAVLMLTTGCSSGEDDSDGNADPDMAAAGTAGSGDVAGTDGAAGTESGGAGTEQASAGTSGEAGASGSSAGAGGGSAGMASDDDNFEPPPEVMEMLDPDTDWEALSIIFHRMYSAYDGVHTFQVPARLDGVTVELSGWEAIPASAVLIEEDPNSEEGGVMITVLEPEPEITIAASSDGLGATAPLRITEATPEQWEIGEARYNNGVEYDMPEVNLVDLFDPNYVPPETPDNLACNNCHTTGAKYLEIQHTPSQAAYIPDADLKIILTMGMKPEGISYSILPEPLQYLYAEFHTWEATDEEIKGLIVYLRSLPPESQGEIKIPDTVIIPDQAPAM